LAVPGARQAPQQLGGGWPLSLLQLQVSGAAACDGSSAQGAAQLQPVAQRLENPGGRPGPCRGSGLQLVPSGDACGRGPDVLLMQLASPGAGGSRNTSHLEAWPIAVAAGSPARPSRLRPALQSCARSGPALEPPWELTGAAACCPALGLLMGRKQVPCWCLMPGAGPWCSVCRAPVCPERPGRTLIGPKGYAAAAATGGGWGGEPPGPRCRAFSLLRGLFAITRLAMALSHHCPVTVDTLRRILPDHAPAGAGRCRSPKQDETSRIPPKGGRALRPVLALPGFRRLWIGQIFLPSWLTGLHVADGVPDRPYGFPPTPPGQRSSCRGCRHPWRLGLSRDPPPDDPRCWPQDLCRQLPARHLLGTVACLGGSLAKRQVNWSLPNALRAAWCCWLPWP